MGDLFQPLNSAAGSICYMLQLLHVENAFFEYFVIIVYTNMLRFKTAERRRSLGQK